MNATIDSSTRFHRRLLRLAEIDLMQRRERVAELRRRLPYSSHAWMAEDIKERGIDLLR